MIYFLLVSLFIYLSHNYHWVEFMLKGADVLLKLVLKWTLSMILVGGNPTGIFVSVYSLIMGNKWSGI